MTTLPLWIWVAGVAVLGIVLAYGILRNRTRSLQERAVTNEATKELYRQEDDAERRIRDLEDKSKIE
jgi:cytochrome c-type biogenesis protein CcmH/NrfF